MKDHLEKAYTHNDLHEDHSTITALILDNLAKMRDELQELKGIVLSTQSNLKEHSAEENIKLDRILDGFPNKDPARHRFLHEQEIDEEAENNHIKREIKRKVLSGGTWVVIVFILVAAWEYIKKQLHLP